MSKGPATGDLLPAAAPARVDPKDEEFPAALVRAIAIGQWSTEFGMGPHVPWESASPWYRDRQQQRVIGGLRYARECGYTFTKAP